MSALQQDVATLADSAIFILLFEHALVEINKENIVRKRKRKKEKANEMEVISFA
ncbi:hypothetical protein QA612_03960 [Evansella sp. AB-P1]|uniref:hypothetical protein n=1 Tax=Evansella sp. AB-P1 TaxID=3037653 RepID=UPI00241DA1F0|nr:hypothetical protein [Evansella sp. AB-P1]MDG5786634.1 hypothetical protein [Evansella sp. AB-P1]